MTDLSRGSIANPIPLLLSGVKGILTVVKTVAETVSNNNTPQDDDQLFIALEANSRYLFILFMSIEIKAASDFRFDFTVPLGATITGNITSAAENVLELDLTALRSITATAAITICPRYIGKITTNSTAGTLQLQWAQLVAVIENTVMQAGSYISLVKLA